jgi:hypothetical protein
MKIELPFSGNLTFDVGSDSFLYESKIKHLNLSSYMIG